jgi:hypothetical protein
VLNSQEGINGIILHNLEMKGLNVNELIEFLVLNLNKNEIEFTILDISKEKIKPINYLETSGMKETNMNLKENENIEKIFAVIQRLNLESETTKLIQERINDEVTTEENESEITDSKRALVANLLKTNIDKYLNQEEPDKGNKIIDQINPQKLKKI